jgi:peptide/nickel transport system substrate-binding protein
MIRLIIYIIKVLTLGFIMIVNTNCFSSEKKLEVILTTEAVLRDPIHCKGYQQFQVINLFLDTIVRKDPSVGVISGIADRWEISQNQMEYIFHLSKNAKFHNNEPIHAEDIQFSLNRHLEKNSPSGIATYLRNVVDKIIVLDQLSVKIILKGPYPPFLELLAMPGFGILSHKSSETNIIGSGPYIFDENINAKSCLKKFVDYKGPTTNIDKFCFRIERDIDVTINQLNSKDVNLAMGSPLEVALSKKLGNELVGNPTFSLVSTHIFLNHSNPFFSKEENRKLIKDIAYKVRSQSGILTKFDNSLDTFLPKGIMPESYYQLAKKPLLPTSLEHQKNKKTLKIVFPYGIFLESTVVKIVEGFKEAGFDVTYINVKGKDLLNPIVEGNYDLLFIPYQGVISDPDGYLDLLDPNSIFAKAKIPSGHLLEELKSVRFIANRSERLKKYEHLLHRFEEQYHIIPFSQNSIPVVYESKIELPNLNFSFHLNLRDLKFKNE